MKGSSAAPAIGIRGRALQYQFIASPVDAVLFAICYLVSVHYWVVEFGPISPYLTHLPQFCVALLVWFGNGYDRTTREYPYSEDIWDFMFVCFKAFLIIALACSVYSVIVTMKGLETRFVLSMTGLLFVTQMIRWTISRVVRIAIRHAASTPIRTVIVGSDDRARAFVKRLRKHQNGRFEIVGVLDDHESWRTSRMSEFAYLGTVADLSKILDESSIDEVHVFLSPADAYLEICSVIRECEARRKTLDIRADFFPVTCANRTIARVGDQPLLSMTTISEDHIALAVKRIIDLFLAASALAMLAPLFMVIACAIRLESPGPVFFRQQRVGKNQRRFNIYKFRSMVVDAEARRSALAGLNELDGPVFKIKLDPRVTAVGRFLRKTSLDELPQLINVVRGEMSLVGPRPPIPEEVEQYTWGQRRRLSVRPGITGLWQVSGRNLIPFEQWVQMDLTYIDTWSLWNDFVILFKTIPAVFRGDGAS